jgi:hypothetical protein
MRLLLMISLCFLASAARAQHATRKSLNIAKCPGKYEANGTIVQVALVNRGLVLIAPGAPVQKLRSVGTNKFKTDAFGDEIFIFVENNGKVQALVSQHAGQSLELKKIADIPDDFNNHDSMLTLKRSTKHFIFLYSPIDSVSVVQIAERLEGNYKKILSDFKLKKIPPTTVRIYPDVTSFRHGINFPNAPDHVLATAFGKDDFRMASPNSKGVDSLMLLKGVTHEFTHCVHLNISYSPNNPRWLWEGVAMFEADWFFEPGEFDLIKNKDFPSLSALNNGMEYMLGYVIIEAIKDIWGFDTVLGLIKKRGDVETVLKLNQSKFEEKIFTHIYNKYIKR